MITRDARVEPFPCTTPGCTLPAAYVMGHLVMIESHHHGRTHTTTLSAEDLRDLLDKIEAPMVT